MTVGSQQMHAAQSRGPPIAGRATSSVPPPPPPTAALLQQCTTHVRPYSHARDHAAVRHICRNVYGGTDDLPERISRTLNDPATHILTAAAAAAADGPDSELDGPDAELDALLCCQQRGDVLWLYGARTREQRRGNGLAGALLVGRAVAASRTPLKPTNCGPQTTAPALSCFAPQEEAERLAAALPHCTALLSITIPANHTMRRLFCRRGFWQLEPIRIWPVSTVALEAHIRLQGQQGQPLQAQQQQQQRPTSLLEALPAAAAAVDSAAARALLPRWRRCGSTGELLSLLLLLRERSAGSAAPPPGDKAVAAVAGDATRTAPAWRLPPTSNAFTWLPAEFELVPAGSARLAELIQQGQVWLLQPPTPAAAPGTATGASAAAAPPEQQQQQQATEVDAAILVSWGPGFRGVRHAGIVAGSSAALAAAVLHASTSADPHCCR